MRGDSMNMMMTSTTILTAISVVLLLILFIIHVKNFMRIKSKLLVGLMIFTGIFLIQNIFSLYYSLKMMQYYAPAVETLVLVLSLLQTLAFAIMLWITWD
jgi:hypothetical protein